MSSGEVTPITAVRKVPPEVSSIVPLHDGKPTQRGTTAAVSSARRGVAQRFGGLLDAVTTRFLTRHAHRPMHVFGSVGVMLLLTGSGTLLTLAFVKLMLGAALDPRSLLIVGAVSVVAGLQLVLTGLVAEMICRLPGLAAKPGDANPSSPFEEHSAARARGR
jgi:hypothetical protein